MQINKYVQLAVIATLVAKSGLAGCVFADNTREMSVSTSNGLREALSLSQVDKNHYDDENYNCRHYTHDLATELNYMGYNAGKVVLDTCDPDTRNHDVVWVKNGNCIYFIDPQTDEFVSSFDSKFKKGWIIDIETNEVLEVFLC